MNLRTTATILATGLALLILAADVAAEDPIFVKWLVIDDPGDETIRYYWEQAEAGALSPVELVDLGTMLFYRGWPNDAVTYFRQALDADPEMSDAWFRMGLVKHHSEDLSGARSAYKKCLKLQSGHAWGNFYLGLLEEQTGDAKSAMGHYETAFKHAPELADPRINPEILSSRLQLGAQVNHFDRERFEKTMPMPILEPATMRKVRRQFDPTPVPTPVPTPLPTIGVRVYPTPAPVATSSGGAATGRSRAPRTRNPNAGAGGAAAGAATGQTSTGTSSGGAVTPNIEDPNSTPYGFPTPPPGSKSPSRSEGGTVPPIGQTSPEASLEPLWPAIYRIAELFI